MALHLIIFKLEEEEEKKKEEIRKYSYRTQISRPRRKLLMWTKS